MMEKIATDAKNKLAALTGSYKDTEAKELSDIIYKMVWLSDYGKEQGLMGIEDIADELWPATSERSCGDASQHLNRDGVHRLGFMACKLVMDVCDPDELEYILGRKYFTNDYQGLHAVMAYIVIYAFIKMLWGNTTHFIEESILSILPDELERAYRAYKIEKLKADEKTANTAEHPYDIPEEFIEEEAHSFMNVHMAGELNRMLLILRPADVRKVVKELDDDALASVVPGLRPEVKKHILGSLPRKIAYEQYKKSQKLCSRTNYDYSYEQQEKAAISIMDKMYEMHNDPCGI